MLVSAYRGGVVRLWSGLTVALRLLLRAVHVPAPGKPSGSARGLLADVVRTRSELLVENAFPRQQLLVAARGVKKPQLRASDRALLVALAAVFSRWRDTLVLVKPDTLLRWHREGLRLFWKWRSRRKPSSAQRLSPEVIHLIRRMGTENRLWGAERIRGELLKLGIAVAKRTVQRYLSRARIKPPDGQRWSTFLRQQAAGIWACDFVEVRDLSFRCHYVFVVIHLETRQLIHAASTMAPTAAWIAQQLRDLTAFDNSPKFLLRDNDGKCAAAFDGVARGASIRVIRTPVLAPKAATYVERFIGSLRRKCLDHVILLGEDHLQRVLSEYRSYFNGARPHQGIGQRRPAAFSSPALSLGFVPEAAVEAHRVLGGLHRDYRLAA
ncbi:MAG TPA: integrase core domain-containing protein [Anaeromyxobacteraceae bacterium]|nr:integrase core domain-containing protein [Anaeromyxobacteraceae bacterium]